MGSSIIVTGGSRGIGKQIVIDLAEAGHQVVLNYCMSEKKAKEIQQELKNREIEIEIFKADVSKREEVRKLVDFTIQKYGKIDVLINNAGVDKCQLFTDITDEDWNTIINTNLNSVFMMSQEVLKNMIYNKSGCIINISSIWGITGASCEVAYSVSKAGIDGMTKALAKEVAPCNIRINSIAPGIIETEMNQQYSKQEIKEIENQIPLGRCGRTVEISKCIKWLIEDNYTTGQIISINGGWHIG